MIKSSQIIEIDRRQATVQKTFEVTGGSAYTLLPSERVMLITLTDGSSIITLPPVVECAGHFYSLHVVSFTAGNVTVNADSNDVQKRNMLYDGDSAGGGFLLAALDDNAVLLSVGLFWHIVARGFA